MKKTKKERAARRAKILAVIVLGCFVIYGAKYVVPALVDKLLDRLEDQRQAELNYNCAYYGAAMNKFYGRDVCEDQDLHRDLLKTSERKSYE